MLAPLAEHKLCAMASQSKFGRTWWGLQWLNALSHIDYDNRLPRGRTYANRGAVTALTVQGGFVTASVQGSRPRPYKVEIAVPPLSDHERNALVEELVKDPVVISKMLIRELDPKVAQYCEALEIKIFPTKWNDLLLRCSCPDWAVPCKHIAAVIYLLSQEIDGNPFTIFTLRGIDLPGELKDRGIFIENEAKAGLPTVSDLLGGGALENELSAGETGFANLPNFGPVLVQERPSYSVLDYSEIKNLIEPLTMVLSTNPPFYPESDFRATYHKAIVRIARKARRILEQARVADGVLDPPEPWHKPRITLSTDYQHAVVGSGRLTRLEQLMEALRLIDEDDLEDLQPESAVFYHLQMLGLHLVANGAIVPQIFQRDASQVQIRWLPATLDENVARILSQIEQILPVGLLGKQEGADLGPLPFDLAAVTLCSLVLDELVTELSGVSDGGSNGDRIVELFFGSRRASFTGPGKGEIASGIQTWLSRFHLGSAVYTPMLWLDEAEDGFDLSLGVERRGDPMSRPTPLSQVLTDSKWEESRYSILQKVTLLCSFFPGLSEHVSSGANRPIRLLESTLPDFLFDVLPIIRLLGLRAVLPKELDRLLRPKLTVKIVGKKEPSIAGFNFSDLLDFDWRVAIGSTHLSKAEFEELVNTAQGVVKFRGEYVYLDPQEIDRLRKQLEKQEKMHGTDLLRVALAEEYFGAPIDLSPAVRKLIKSLTSVNDVAEPAGMVAELRPYQARGYQWLYRNTRAGFGSVIADDMGLGKTLQVITLLAKLKEEGELTSARALVVVPTTLLSNWSKEIERFAPSLSSQVFHGSQRELGQEVADVVLTSYGVARSDASKLRKLPWRIVVTDEAQNIKNPTTAQTKAVKSIPARTFVAMSGTPVENRLSEYWSIMDYANRGLLGSLPSFVKEYAIPIQKDHDHEVAARFKRVAAPFLLRRLKSDKSIIKDLPDKVEQDYLCDLSKDQVALYESVVREGLAALEGESDLFKRQGAVLQMILALKQICNHPAHYLKRGDTDVSRSGKVQSLLDLLEPIYESHEKVLVFTQFREAGELLSGWINDRFSRRPMFLHGGLTRKQRDDMVSKFQEDPTERAFVLSLKAGGTGLNLTAATYVIHFDLWWNPAVEQQATDRAYRIGQDRNVTVYRLITRNTFEERINEMIQLKRELAELSVGTGENWIGNLDNKALREVFSLS